MLLFYQKIVLIRLINFLFSSDGLQYFIQFRFFALLFLKKLMAGFPTNSPPAILCLSTSSTKTEAQIFAQHSQTYQFIDLSGRD